MGETGVPADPPAREGRPLYRGVKSYRDPQGRFAFKYPSDWKLDDLDQDRDGVIVMPDPDRPATYFAIWLTRLPEHVAAEDLDVLREGLDDTLKNLPDFESISAEDKAISNLLKLERRFRFSETDATGRTVTRQRRQWLLYVDTWQMVLIFQGETPGEFAYWTPMGNYAFTRFELPEALWFATDRDLAGASDSTDPPEDEPTES